MSAQPKGQVLPHEHLALRAISQFLTRVISLVSRPSQKHLRLSSKQEDFSRKSFNKDGHLITEDSVLPTTAPGGAPERNRCYQTPATLLISPLRPASFARSAHLALLPSLRPRWGLALWLMLS